MNFWVKVMAIWVGAAIIVILTTTIVTTPVRSQTTGASSYTWDMYAAGKRGVDWPDQRFPFTDQLSNIYPPECRQDLSKKIDTPIQFMTQAAINAGRPRGSWPWNAKWQLFKDGHREIWINKDLEGYELWDALQHERCHELMYRMTGKSMWHDDRRGS